MSSRSVVVGLVVCSCIVLSGCTTSSKVDKFVEQADNPIIISDMGSSGEVRDTHSDNMLLDTREGNAVDQTDGKRGIYQDYNLEAVTKALSSGQRVVIIVYDSTDDNTVRLDKDINISLGRIPADVVMLKISYPLAREMYRIKQPNTIIFIDATGKITNTVDGGVYTMDSLLYYF